MVGVMNIRAACRLRALPAPADRRVESLAKEKVLERWSETAGLRPAAVSRGDNVITMFDTIGEDYWTGGGVTAKGVSAQLRAIGDRPVEVQINSFGGSMFEGIAIYNVLREHPQDVTVKIMGLAASAASVIAMAGNRIEIGAASFLMIHNCWTMALGNADDLQQVADYLRPFDTAMADVYAARSGQTVAQAAEWMKAETYFSGSQAIDLGLADDLLPADQVRDDEDAQASASAVHEVRAMELSLVRGGMSRTDARARIKALKGTPGAALPPTPGAGVPRWAAEMAALLQSMKS